MLVEGKSLCNPGHRVRGSRLVLLHQQTGEMRHSLGIGTVPENEFEQFRNLPSVQSTAVSDDFILRLG